MFEDTPEFVARHIIREAQGLSRLAGAAVLPRAGRLRAGRLVLVALPRPLGRRRVPEEPGRADVPPVLRREHAARRRLQLRSTSWASCSTTPARSPRPSATRRASSTPTTASSSPTARRRRTRWCGTPTWRPDDIVVVDRNCHVSILHAITMTGAIPVFLTPTRNHLGIIGPIPLEEFQPGEHPASKIEANPFARAAKNKKPRILTITQSTYDGIAYNVEMLKETLGRQHRDAAFRRGLAAARGVPRLLQGHARDRQGPAAQQGGDDLRDALDAQAAGRACRRRRRSSCRNRRPASSTATSSTRRT